MNYDDNNNRWIQYSDKRRRTTSSDSSPFQESTSRSRQLNKQASHTNRASRKDDLPERRTTRPRTSFNTDEPRSVYRSCDELQQHIEDGIATRHKLEASRRYRREENSSSYGRAQTRRESYGARSRSYSDGGDTAKQDGLSSRRRKARTSDDSKDESLFRPIDYADFSSVSSKRQSGRNRTERNGHMQRTTRYQSSDTGESRRNRNLDTYGQNSRRRNSDTYNKRDSQYYTKHTRGKFGLIAIAVAIIAAVLLCVFALTRCTQEAASTDGANTDSDATTILAEEPQTETTDFTPSTSALDSISADGGVQTFSLSNLDALELDESALAAIEDAVAAIEATNDVGFVFYDLETGRGISLNPDTEVYGASSFKALYALYVCEALVETGQLSLSDSCPVSYVIDSGSWHGNSGASSYPVSELIEAAIVSSDNNAFCFLRDAYDDLGFSSWITEIGADDVIAETNTSRFPTYSPRSSAKLWTDMYEYLNTESETAEWLGSLLTQTTTSFIRNALESSDAEDLTVSNKAGWISDSDSDYSAINDAGIIEADGHTYILSIMTSLPDGESNRELFETLAAAIFDARESLNLQES